MPLKIQYPFNGDAKSYTCLLTFDQYKNFKNLPVIKECKILNSEDDVESHKEEMQKILNLTAKNDVSHIQNLSQIV